MAIQFEGFEGTMGGAITRVPVFPGERFGLGYPEAIGDAARACWRIQPRWDRDAGGSWKSTGREPGELSYTMTVTPGDDMVDVHFTLTNESERHWKQTVAFNCFQCGGVPAIRDHECVRHWVRTGGQFKRLIEIPRKYGPRPAIQLYSVEGAPGGKEIPFVANFKATPDAIVEGWIAIESRDGKRLAATVSKPAMFLFQNMEYSCIHSGAGFGPLRPGETATAINKAYLVEASLDDWYKRMKAELA